MLKERRAAATIVANKLFAAEAAIDAAVTAVAELTAAMPQARNDAHLAACVGQDALMAAMETAMQLVQARARIVATHAALRQTQTDIGLSQVMFGDTRCPPELASADAPVRRHLASVA